MDVTSLSDLRKVGKLNTERINMGNNYLLHPELFPSKLSQLSIFHGTERGGQMVTAM